MVTREDRCVGCTGGLYGCVYCTLKNSIVLTCDCCSEEVDKLYWFDGQQYCEDCVLENLEQVYVEA